VSYYPPRPLPAPAGKKAAHSWIVVAIGIVFGFVMIGALLGAGDGAPSGYSDPGTSGYSSGSGGGHSEIYDGGSVTTTDDGEVIYSDDSGTGFSSDGCPSAPMFAPQAPLSGR